MIKGVLEWSAPQPGSKRHTAANKPLQRLRAMSSSGLWRRRTAWRLGVAVAALATVQAGRVGAAPSVQVAVEKTAWEGGEDMAIGITATGLSYPAKVWVRLVHTANDLSEHCTG